MVFEVTRCGRIDSGPNLFGEKVLTISPERILRFLAEREGFEPSMRFRIHTFQACSFGLSDTSPLVLANQRENMLAPTVRLPQPVVKKLSQAGRATGAKAKCKTVEMSLVRILRQGSR